ncbi:MAG: hypothetical protein MR998_08420 [Lachnospiraceae bacterium]|nr:hypothetical protein [Lachnospiraceae bacterium]
MQNNITVATTEKDLNVTYGMINFHPEREQARTSLKYILSDVNDIRKSYIRLGFHLHEFDRLKYYEDFGYATLAEFCEVNLGLDKSAVSRCISVFWEFAKINDNITRTRTMFLDDKYENFSYSQLCEMVSMTADQRKLVKPEMTIKQIRELKKKKKKKENVSQDVSPVATSQPTFLENFKKYSGVVLRNYIKNFNEDDCVDVKHITLFDSQGKEIFKYNTCDILYEDNNHIFLRQVDDIINFPEED